MKNRISLHQLRAKIDECTRRIIMIRQEMTSDEESGKDSGHHRRIISNLHAEINRLQSVLQNIRRDTGRLII